MTEIKINSSNLPVYVGIIMTLVNLYHSHKTSKKTQFINTVTNERIRWITSVREYIAEYYSAIDYNSIGSKEVINKKIK